MGRGRGVLGGVPVARVANFVMRASVLGRLVGIVDSGVRIRNG